MSPSLQALCGVDTGLPLLGEALITWCVGCVWFGALHFPVLLAIARAPLDARSVAVAGVLRSRARLCATPFQISIMCARAQARLRHGRPYVVRGAGCAGLPRRPDRTRHEPSTFVCEWGTGVARRVRVVLSVGLMGLVGLGLPEKTRLDIMRGARM